MNNLKLNIQNRNANQIATTIGACLLLSSTLWSNIAHAKIYTCVDASGRRITSDRPISACLDREQKQMTSSGVVKRVIEPSYTAAERKEKERLQRIAQAEAKKKRARAKALSALLQRYPNSERLEKARLTAAADIKTRIQDGSARLKEKQIELAALNEELAFYKKTPERTPRALRVKKNSIDTRIEKLQRYITTQRQELAELHKNFDTIRETLKPKWER